MKPSEENVRSGFRSTSPSTVLRALELLDLIALHAGDGRPAGMRLTEIARAAGINKTTTLRHLGALTALGYVEYNADRQLYRLGMKLLELGQLVLGNMDLRIEASGLVRQLSEDVGETVHLVVREGNEVIYIDKVEAPSPIRLFSRIGARCPIHSTAVGRALLAAESDEEIIRLLHAPLQQRTPRTLTTVDALLRDIQQVRTRGYAIDDQENEFEVCCVAAAIKDHRGQAVAAVSISGLASRLAAAGIPRLGDKVRETANRISEKLGYQCLVVEKGYPSNE